MRIRCSRGVRLCERLGKKRKEADGNSVKVRQNVGVDAGAQGLGPILPL